MFNASVLLNTCITQISFNFKYLSEKIHHSYSFVHFPTYILCQLTKNYDYFNKLFSYKLLLHLKHKSVIDQILPECYMGYKN